jgi:4-diphosphocytidyl-2-C-methyl-D-erythritol kinase
MGTSCVIQAPGKINLHLRVGERRGDGYHELESIFLCLDFADTLCFEIGAPDAAFRTGAGAGAQAGAGPSPACFIRFTGGLEPSWTEALAPDRNIITRAAALFRERTGFDKPVQVCLEKRIPLGGGLGGGSSDAASTLLALDALAGTALSRDALLEMAAALGSDVPFFLSGGAALVTGRGENIRPLEAPGCFWVVLVNPGFPSGTAEAFALLDEARRSGGAGETAAAKKSGEALIDALKKSPAFWPYGNDFLPLFLASFPDGEISEAGMAYRDMLVDLRVQGAEFSGLSGAGSTCFGLFTKKGAAKKAVQELLRRWNFVELTFSLARSAKAVVQYD